MAQARSPAAHGVSARRRGSPGSRRDRGRVSALRTLAAAAVAWVAAAVAVPASARAETAETVDLELVLAVDCSYSVSDEEFRLQILGLAEAFRDPEVHRALAAATPRGLAVSLVQWSGRGEQLQALGWTRIDGPADAEAVAARIEGTPRLVPEGPTALGDAISFSARLFATSGFEGLRRVIDVSGDGRRNTGLFPAAARRHALAVGATVNGLAILNEDPTLDAYYREQVIGGDGAFVLAARDYRDFARAIRLKLLTEIRNSPLALDGDADRPRAVTARAG